MEYKGYTAEITFDDHAEVFHGQVKHLRDVVTFESDSVEGLKREFKISVDDYIEWCHELGQEPERPYSGKFLVRIDPVLHREVAMAADRMEMSLNAWAGEALRRFCDEKPDREVVMEQVRARA